MDGEYMSSTCGRTILNPQIKWPGDRNGGGIKTGFTHKPHRHHPAVGVAHPIHALRIDTVFVHQVMDGARDIADIVDVVFRRNPATPAARIPTQLIQAVHPRYRRAVQVGDDEAVFAGYLIHLQPFLGSRAFNTRSIAQPAMPRRESGRTGSIPDSRHARRKRQS
jgi:hypothetical protein